VGRNVTGFRLGRGIGFIGGLTDLRLDLGPKPVDIALAQNVASEQIFFRQKNRIAVARFRYSSSLRYFIWSSEDECESKADDFRFDQGGPPPSRIL